MFKHASSSTTATTASWLVAVLGAAAVLVAPVTPWMIPVEITGMIICLVASGVLAVSFFRH